MLEGALASQTAVRGVCIAIDSSHAVEERTARARKTSSLSAARDRTCGAPR